jgi:glycosyltransferase involved in cell wall biosynthesis
MPVVSVNILTKNRGSLLRGALDSVARQSFTDYEVIIVNDGSSDETPEIIREFKHPGVLTIEHKNSIGVARSRQEALLASTGEFIAVLDDDDEWIDRHKLKKQVEYLQAHPDAVLVGGARRLLTSENPEAPVEELPLVFCAETDKEITRTMLFRNNFFTSTVMFRRQAAMEVGGFLAGSVDVAEDYDFAEDYDLWLRLKTVGTTYNFQEPFDRYRVPSYSRARFRQFLRRQLSLIRRHRNDYPWYWLARTILTIRIHLPSARFVRYGIAIQRGIAEK